MKEIPKDTENSSVIVCYGVPNMGTCKFNGACYGEICIAQSYYPYFSQSTG